jgi:hypothetical protein
MDNKWISNYINEISEDENDPQEITVGNYQTKYFHVCPTASTLYKDIESKGVDMDMAERSARLQDALYFVEEHIQRDGYEPDKDYVMVANNIAKNIMKMAKLMGLEEEHDYIQGHVDTIEKVVKEKGLEERVMELTEKNVPTDSSKWSYYKAQAKKKFDVYPSAYANGWAAKQYKAAGGGWKTENKESVDESINEAKSMDMNKRLKVYDKLKKGDEITIKYGSSMSSGNEAKFKVTKGKTLVGKQKVERIILQNVANPKGVKFYLYQRNGNVTMAIGDMAASIEDMHESVNEGISVFDERHFGKKGIIIMIDDNGKKVSAIFKNKKNADKYNRNKSSDLQTLLKLAKNTPYPKAIDESVNEATPEEEDKFHRNLDKLVHKTFGHSSDEEKMNEANEPDIISQLRDIVSKKQNQKLKDPKSGKKMRVDLYSASAVTQVYDALKQQSNKDKFVGMGLVGMVNVAFKLMKKENTSEVIEEGEYQGRKVELNKPMQGDVKKFKVYVNNEKGNVVKVNFGQKGMVIKKDNPAARKSFRARMNCDNPGPKWKANYWSCKKW